MNYPADVPGSKTIKYFRDFLLCSALLLALFLYQLKANQLPKSFESFEKLQWQTGTACTRAPRGSPLSPAPGVLLKGSGNCRSELFELKTNVLEIEFAGKLAKNSEVSLFSQNGEPLGTFALKNSPGSWQTSKLLLDPNKHQSKAFVQLESKKGDQQIFLRNRLNFYAEKSPLKKLKNALHLKKAPSLVVCAFLALLIALNLKGLCASNRTYFFALLLLSLAVHFRGDAFFHWDEWHVIERFQKNGLETTFKPHNEHYLPAFFASYFLQTLALGANYWAYLLISISFHALNSFLLAILLEKLAAPQSSAGPAAKTLGALFLLSSLHTEVLHWAFELSLLLCQTACLLALLAVQKFNSSGGWKNILLLSLCILIAPFLFGSGLNAVLQVAALVFFTMHFRKRGSLIRAFVSLAIAGIFAALAASIYIYGKGDAASTLSKSSPLEHLQEITDYIFVGSQVGTVIRGLGLFPSLELTAAKELISQKTLLELEAATGLALSPELAFAYLGLIANLFILLLTLASSREKKRALRLWLLGQSIILLSFLLPALVRYKFGIHQSLALRYQYSALCGFAISLLPLFLQIHNQRKAKLFLGAVVFLYTSLHLYHGLSFDNFSSSGAIHKNYLAQHRHWNSLLSTEKEDASFEGKGTTYAHLQPLFPPTITPGRHPDQVYAVANWLSPECYPLRSGIK